MALKIKNNPVQFGGHLGGRTLLIVLLVVSLILFVAYARESEEGPIHTLQNTTSSLVTPLTAVGTTVGSLAVSGSMSVEDLTASDASYNQLKENNARLSQMVVELEEYRQEAARLESLIGLADAYGFTSIAARVVGYSTDSYNRSITLDAGSASGIKNGMPVMGATGVIGQVISTTPLRAMFACSPIRRVAFRCSCNRPALKASCVARSKARSTLKASTTTSRSKRAMSLSLLVLVAAITAV